MVSILLLPLAETGNPTIATNANSYPDVIPRILERPNWLFAAYSAGRQTS